MLLNHLKGHFLTSCGWQSSQSYRISMYIASRRRDTWGHPSPETKDGPGWPRSPFPYLKRPPSETLEAPGHFLADLDSLTEKELHLSLGKASARSPPWIPTLRNTSEEWVGFSVFAVDKRALCLGYFRGKCRNWTLRIVSVHYAAWKLVALGSKVLLFYYGGLITVLVGPASFGWL